MSINKNKPEEINIPDYVLTEKQKISFKHCLMTGIYKQLYANGFLQKNQLDKLIAMHSTKGGTIG